MNDWHVSPATLSISLDILSRPVAFPTDNFLRTEDISWDDVGFSIGSSITDSDGGGM